MDKAINYEMLEKKLYTAVIADILDDLGYREQVMSHRIRPLEASSVFAGKAVTVLSADVYAVPAAPYQKELEAIESLTMGDVLVATTNGSTSCGFWGELLSTAAKARGSRGAVIDGFTRDARQIRRLGYPVFARGFSAYDSKGRSDVIDYNVPIRCGGVLVHPGDLIFGDEDGVVAVPQQVMEETVRRAFVKVDGENQMRKALEQGMSVTQAFQKYGIL